MPTQESKAHHVGEWASLRNTSPEIAEAIFEVAKYDEKLAEQIWEEGNDEVLVRAFEKRTKTRSSGVSKPSNVKRLSVSPPLRGGSLYFAALFITALNLSTGQKPFASTGQPFSSSVTRCAGDCSDSTLALRSCSEL